MKLGASFGGVYFLKLCKSMNNIQIFQNEQFGKVRIAMNESDEPLFCLADVCQILDLIPSKVAQRLDKDVLSKYPLETAGGIQQANFVDEDGLYDAILDSRKPEAKKVSQMGNKRSFALNPQAWRIHDKRNT